MEFAQARKALPAKCATQSTYNSNIYCKLEQNVNSFSKAKEKKEIQRDLKQFNGKHQHRPRK